MEQFVWASRYLGSRFDLVQAGGGNTSVKSEATLVVKASGLSIGDISHDTGYATLSLEVLRQKLFALLASNWRGKTKQELEAIGKDLLEEASRGEGRPSIETFLHAVFKKYTLHTHPVAVNSFVGSESGFQRLKELYPSAYFADYATPGVELLLTMGEVVRKTETTEGPVVVFLKNHGLLVSSNNASEAVALTDSISSDLASLAGLSFAEFRKAGDLFSLLYQHFGILDPTCAVMDPQLNEAILAHAARPLVHFCPDVFIYMGYAVFPLDQGVDGLIEYQRTFGALPSIFVSDGLTLIRAKSYKKLKETEDMLRFYVMVNSAQLQHQVSGLDRDEIAYLGNWDAEKFRQGV
ncbi:class II aldolase/adducin family protein [Allohahella marinimesophila]|uniref:Class II aldolase/adducin N-terminal domain-containing protein n=1 Tax=Allohahella marinimesophila TaxID=1054972 RepID=A0ABP7P0Q9_9GAMM